MQAGQKGQSSVELLIIMAVSLVVLAAVFSYSSQSMIELNNQKLIDTAQTSVETLAAAANDVYYQGVGARKKVYYIVPNNVDESKSGIEADSFVLNILDSDVYASAEVPVTGTLPTAVGGHWVWITAYEGYVFIGTENISVDKTSSYVTLSQSDSEEDSITITNEGASTAEIFLVATWLHSDVTLGLGIENFSLAAGADQNVTLAYASNATAVGNYAGTLSIGAAFPSLDENIFIPLNAEIVTVQEELLLFPVTYATSLIAGGSENVDMNVCNNGGNTLSNITFSASGDISSWLGVPNNIPSLASGACVNTSFDLNVPGGTSDGSYYGAVNAADDSGSGSNSDSTSITAIVGGGDASDFSFDWSTATFSGDGKKLRQWTIGNTGTEAITITRMKVREWSANDQDNAKLRRIKFNDSQRWSGNANDEDVWRDISPDYALAGGSSSSTNNKLEFSRQVDNDDEDFYLVFEFSDGSTYTTTTYNP